MLHFLSHSFILYYMIKISVCMIVKNESEVLARALNCITSFADEIVIVDTGSTDQTRAIAKQFTDKVYDFVWCDDFSKARNFSFEKASGEYIMWLDADDVIPETEQHKILALKNSLDCESGPDMIMCHYVASVDSQGEPDFYYYRERFIKNGKGLHWSEPVHECIPPAGTVSRMDIKIYHKKMRPATPHRNLKIYQKLEKSGVQFSPRAMYYYGRELYFNQKYRKAIKILKKFLNSEGWFENKIDACSILSQCYLREGLIECAKRILFRAFCYAEPRGKTCCEIGKIYQNLNDNLTAIFWYKLALNCADNTSGWIEKKYTHFTPAVELCVCCYRLGKMKEAKYYHELSKSFAPESSIVKYNEQFFKN